jgi:hypothetical protein
MLRAAYPAKHSPLQQLMQVMHATVMSSSPITSSYAPVVQLQ